MGKPKFVFRVGGDNPVPKTDEIKEQDDEIARLEREIEMARQGRLPTPRKTVPKPTKRKPSRRTLISPAERFNVWAPGLKERYEKEFNLAFAGESNRIDVLPKDDSDWRITILSWMEREFSVTLFYDWKNDECLNIKKHSIECIKKESLYDAIDFLLNHRQQF